MLGDFELSEYKDGDLQVLSSNDVIKLFGNTNNDDRDS